MVEKYYCTKCDRNHQVSSKIGKKHEKHSKENKKQKKKKPKKEKTKKKQKKKKIYRSKENKMIGGVCAGIAEHLDIDPIIIRLLWVLFTLISLGAGVLLYLIAWGIMPQKK